MSDDVRYDISNWNWDEASEVYVHLNSGERITMAEAQRRGIPADLPPLQRFEGGGQRESQDGKPRYDLLMPLGVPMDRQFLTRLARHMGESLKKYPERNWEQFSDVEALDRCRASAFRHFIAWMSEPPTVHRAAEREDHAAAVVFNLMAAEHVRTKLEGED